MGISSCWSSKCALEPSRRADPRADTRRDAMKRDEALARRGATGASGPRGLKLKGTARTYLRTYTHTRAHPHPSPCALRPELRRPRGRQSGATATALALKASVCEYAHTYLDRRVHTSEASVDVPGMVGT